MKHMLCASVDSTEWDTESRQQIVDPVPRLPHRDEHVAWIELSTYLVNIPSEALCKVPLGKTVAQKNGTPLKEKCDMSHIMITKMFSLCVP
jgi:hypothetical protein